MILEGFLNLRNPQSTWIHYPNALIPIYENLLYILALYKTRQVEQMQEAKRLFTHLLHFENEGKFPTYLHNYPFVKVDPRLLLPLTLIDRDFYPCKEVIQKLLAASFETEGVKTFRGEKVSEVTNETLLFATSNPSLYKTHLEQVANRFVENEEWTQYEKQPSMMRIMIEYAKSKKILRWIPELVLFPDVQIDASEIPPIFIGEKHEVIDIAFNDEERERHLTCYREEFDFDAACEGGKIDASFKIRRPFDPQDCKNPLISFFLNYPEHSKVFVNGVRAMTFRSGDRVCIEAGETEIELVFEASDQWMGHILRGNRPRQTIVDKFSAFDLQIGLRSVQYKEGERVRVQLSPSKVGLSVASPMACIP